MKIIKEDLIKLVIEDGEIVERGLQKQDIRLVINAFIRYISESLESFESGETEAMIKLGW